MTTDIDCNCDVPEEARLGPCPTHATDEYRAWVEETAPRYAKALNATDPFIDREDWPADASQIPEFQPLRNALSPEAREVFDDDWQLEADHGEGLDAWETALTIRDTWPDLVLGYERDALRCKLSQAGRDGQYPIGHSSDDPYDSTQPFANEQLLEEADQLAELARRAQHLERMLRDHAAGGQLRADQL
ncbi:hypothetical protein ACU635_14210 [[Actinomadura] parvosata]|uniref:hypothetical protein n=1 Tax=[Actinomadura] parvosata TaxID=1955412 RepID=UPI00406BE7BA